METLDEIDKKILYELSNNARQSYKELASKINSRKDTVAYHISLLQKKGIITKFVPVISLSKLGIFAGKIYLELHGLTEEIKRNLIDSLIKNPSISWVTKAVGNWDLLVGVYYYDVIDFSSKKNSILSQLSPYIASYEVTLLEDGLVFGRDYLFNNNTVYRQNFVFGGENEKGEVDETEMKILSLIKNDGRFEYTDVANKLNLDSRTVQSKVKNLKDKGIIQGFTTFIDIKKLGMQLHKLCIYLKDHKEENISQLINYLKENPRTIHLIKALGSWELEVEIESGDLFFIYDYISELKNKFPELIKKIDLVTITDELKLEFFPED